MTDMAHYSGTAFDRAGTRRRDDAWIARQLGDPGARIVPVWRGRNLLKGEAAALLPATESWQLVESAPSEPIFLGIDERHALFARLGRTKRRRTLWPRPGAHRPCRTAPPVCPVGLTDPTVIPAGAMRRFGYQALAGRDAIPMNYVDALSDS